MHASEPSLHHPRPKVARSTSSGAPVSYITRPSIQYPTTPVARPPAPAPASPGVSVIHSGNGHVYSPTESDVWRPQASPDRYESTSPTLTRRSKKSSDATSPTYVEEHIIHYPDLSRNITQPAVKPAVRRLRSASSPEYLKQGAYTPTTITVPADDRPIAPSPEVPIKKPRQNGGVVHFTPDNLFVALGGHNVLKIYNLTPSNNGPNSIMESVREEILPHWAGGIRTDDEGRGEWRVRLNGNVWSSGGSDRITAHRMVASLFSVLASQGYSYLCSVQNTHWGHRLSFVDIPADINVAILNALQHSTLFDVEEEDESFPKPGLDQSADAGEGDDEDEEIPQVHVYRLTKRSKVHRSRHDAQLFLTRNEKADMLMLLSQLLKIIASFGFRLDAAVPLGPVGPLGLRGRRELWIFKATSWKGRSWSS
ncbi:hypothetical protein FRC17_010138 [Serendipita sp. 399]|nr:hypothetical protein FRC17_010138 [Serendipita sp. 399]